jgi:hypothetical protein
MSDAAVKALVEDVLLWKFLGSAAWSGAALLAGATAHHCVALQPAPGGVFSMATYGLWLTSLAVLYSQRRIAAAIDVPPIYAPGLGCTHSSWLSLLLTRCALRTRKALDILDALLFYSACGVSGSFAVWAIGSPDQPGAAGGGAHARPLLRLLSCSAGASPARSRPIPVTSLAAPRPAESRWLLAYGAAVGWVYAAVYLVRAQNVLSYPLLQRPRLYRALGRWRASE